MKKMSIYLGTALLGFSIPTTGGNLMNPYPPELCGSDHCNSLEETKLYQVGNPIVFQAWAVTGECLRIRVEDESGNNTKATVITPRQTVITADFQNGDTEDFTVRSLSRTGAHTIILGAASGGGTGSRVEVKVGRYSSSDNVNCPASATRSSIQHQEIVDEIVSEI